MVQLRSILIVVSLAFACSTAAADLQPRIDELIRRAPLGEAVVAVSVWDADSRIELARVNHDKPMIPASNMKLLTTGAALHVLGPDFEFGTAMFRDGARLIVRGDGDPAFGDPELLVLMTRGNQTGIDVNTLLDYWVQAVRETGITELSELVVDDRIFDRDFVHDRWPADQLNRRYCAEVAGLNFHLNVVHFLPRPSSGARPFISDYTPSYPGLNVRNSATNRTGPKDKSTVWIARNPGGNDLTVYGNVRFAYRVPVAATVHDPPRLFASLLAERLRHGGVSVADARTATEDETLVGEPIGPRIATPMGTILARCNEDSENVYAEALLKRTGHEVTGQPGSWLNGRAALRHIVHERLGHPKYTEGLAVSDGSGLSRDNRVSAETLAAWLANLHADERLGALFVDSLARAGAEGTLRKRFGDSDLHGAIVHAKSGYINFVSCLSGYVTSPGGPRRSFSILVNDLRRPGSVHRAKRLQEQIVEAIAQEMVPAGVTMGSDRD